MYSNKPTSLFWNKNQCLSSLYPGAFCNERATNFKRISVRGGRAGRVVDMPVSEEARGSWPPPPPVPSLFGGIYPEFPIPPPLPRQLEELSKEELVQLFRACARMDSQQKKAFRKFDGRTPTPTFGMLSSTRTWPVSQRARGYWRPVGLANPPRPG